MREAGLAAAGWLLLIATAASAQPGQPSGPVLAKAARATVLSGIDPNETQCRPGRTVEAWLRELTGRNVRSVSWTGGRCRLEVKENPRDSGGGLCGHAVIRYTRPADASDVAEIEVYFETGAGGRPGKPFAFRGAMRGPDGPDYVRFTSDFETLWRSRFPARADPTCPR